MSGILGDVSILHSLHQELKNILSVVTNDSERTDEVVEEVERFWQLDHVGVAIVNGEAEFEDSFDRP
jgi:hypothetical protein